MAGAHKRQRERCLLPYKDKQAEKGLIEVAVLPNALKKKKKKRNKTKKNLKKTKKINNHI